MFLGIEIDFFIGVGLGLTFFVLAVLFLRERKERKYQELSKLSWRNLSDEQYASAQSVNGDLEEERVTAERLRATLEGAKIVQNFLTETVSELVDEVGDREDDLEAAEEAIEELEEESDGFKESADDAFDLVRQTLAWGERILNVLDRMTERR